MAHEEALPLRSAIVGIAAPQRGAASSDPPEPPGGLLPWKQLFWEQLN
jgi:hypothetical protein